MPVRIWRVLRPGDYDCLSCGACCEGHGNAQVADDYVNVHEAEASRVPAEYLVPKRRVVRRAGPTTNDKLGSIAVAALKFVRVAGGTRCAALLGGPAMGAASCAIYELRPAECRAVPPGSYICLRLREAHELEAPGTTAEAVRRSRREESDQGESQ